MECSKRLTALWYALDCAEIGNIYTLYADIHRVRGAGLLQHRIGIHQDPGEGQGQGLAGSGQPARGKMDTQWPGTGQWTVHSDRSVKYNNYIMFNKQNIRI